MISALCVAAVIGLSVCAFQPGLHNEFLNWDDDRNFLLNTDYRGLSAANWQWAWSTYHLGVWQPVGWLLLGLQYRIGAMAPATYHTASLIIHAANAALLYFLAASLLAAAMPAACNARPIGTRVCAAAAAMLFAAHPLRVEAIAWVSCQPYLPAAFFCLLGTWAYVHTQRPPSATRRRRIGLAITFVCYLLAVMSKAVAVSLPVLLLILDLYPLGRWQGRGQANRPFRGLARLVIEKAPFFAVAVVVSVWAAAAKDYSDTRVPLGDFDASARLAQAAYGLIFYLWKSIIPTGLLPYYRLPGDIGLAHASFGLCGLGVLALTVGVVVMRQRWPALLAAWGAYVVILIPNLGIVQISQQTVADRYSYLAIMPVVILSAGAIFKAWQHADVGRKVLRGALAIGIGLAAAGLVSASRRQVTVWHDSDRLWRTVIDADPKCAVAECNLGAALLAKGEYAQASVHVSRAIDLKPDFAFAYANLGVICCKARKFEDAIAFFEEALDHRPDLPRSDLAKVHAGLGEAYAGLRRDGLAWKHTRKAQQLGSKEAEKMIEYLRRFSREPKRDD
ncbi:MAG: tetratricopeptide repeat protein [Planctomycetota bacterium]